MADQPPSRDLPLTRRAVVAQGMAAAAFLSLPAQWRAAGATAPSSQDASSYRDAALAAERWIARSAIRRGDLLEWPADPADAKSVQRDLYTGTPGVVLFYLELFHATGDRRWLEPAHPSFSMNVPLSPP